MPDLILFGLMQHFGVVVRIERPAKLAAAVGTVLHIFLRAVFEDGRRERLLPKLSFLAVLRGPEMLSANVTPTAEQGLYEVSFTAAVAGLYELDVSLLWVNGHLGSANRHRDGHAWYVGPYINSKMFDCLVGPCATHGQAAMAACSEDAYLHPIDEPLAVQFLKSPNGRLTSLPQCIQGDAPGLWYQTPIESKESCLFLDHPLDSCDPLPLSSELHPRTCFLREQCFGFLNDVFWGRPWRHHDWPPNAKREVKYVFHRLIFGLARPYLVEISWCQVCLDVACTRLRATGVLPV